MVTTQPLIFIQLNEVNFDIVQHYIAQGSDLPHLRQLLDEFVRVDTHAEDRYEELEPWIQWVSMQTGKTFAEHRVFRLGDVVHSEEDLIQIFEWLENQGLRVGAVAPMNARNRLKAPVYFVPDPWTDTEPDSSGFSRRLAAMLRQSVNDNASGRLTLRTQAVLAEIVLRTFAWGYTGHVFRMKRLAETTRPWTRALVLDQLIHLVHRHLWLAKRPDVSFVFLNAGAHIQHHYLFNAQPRDPTRVNPAWYIAAEHDPVLDMLKFYDRVVGDYLKLSERHHTKMVVATGLTQVPYDRVKFYYRLTSHEQFLRNCRVRFSRVLPRMTRDFEIYFDDPADIAPAHQKLSQMTLVRTGRAVFGEFDLREKSMFLSLVYPDEIQPDDSLSTADGRVERFGDQVSFVAIKNGMHSTRGFAFFSKNCKLQPSRKAVHVAKLFDMTLAALGLRTPDSRPPVNNGEPSPQPVRAVQAAVEANPHV